MRAACCHSGLGTRPHYDHFGENVERRWLVRPASQASFKRFVRGDGWCFDVGCLRWANRWLGQGARERELSSARHVLSADPGWRWAWRAATRAMCLGNDNDTVVHRHGSGRVRGVSFDDRVRSRWSRYAADLDVNQVVQRSIIHVLISYCRYIKVLLYILVRCSKNQPRSRRGRGHEA